MKKFLAIILAMVRVLGISSFAFADETVPMKIAVWTSNEAQLELLGSFVQEFADILNDSLLGLAVVALGLIAWIIILLIKDPSGVFKKKFTK